MLDGFEPYEYFEEFIYALELRHFEPWEFLIGLERGNTEPPRELWDNIAMAAKVVDLCRSHFKKPIKITSAYRNPEYNRKVGGARRSSHPAFSAIDFKVVGLRDQSEAAAYCRSLRGSLLEFPVPIHRTVYQDTPHGDVDEWDERGGRGCVLRFAGGVGQYETFTHVDGRGLNHSWTG